MWVCTGLNMLRIWTSGELWSFGSHKGRLLFSPPEWLLASQDAHQTMELHTSILSQRNVYEWINILRNYPTSVIEEDWSGNPTTLTGKTLLLYCANRLWWTCVLLAPLAHINRFTNSYFSLMHVVNAAAIFMPVVVQGNWLVKIKKATTTTRNFRAYCCMLVQKWTSRSIHHSAVTSDYSP
jgi:hypothetical protein